MISVEVWIFSVLELLFFIFLLVGSLLVEGGGNAGGISEQCDEAAVRFVSHTFSDSFYGVVAVFLSIHKSSLRLFDPVFVDECTEVFAICLIDDL